MEEKIVYFEKPGKENTTEVIKLVLERAKLRDIHKIVLASTRGNTAESFLNAVEGKDIHLVVVPWQFSLTEEGNRFPQELVKELQEKYIWSILERCYLILANYMGQMHQWL